MLLPLSLKKAIFLERANRFACWVRLGEKEEKAHLPNSGRLRELLTPGRVVYLVESRAPHRRTRYDMLLAALGDMLVSLDARLPGDVVAEALKAGALAPFRSYPQVQREVTFGHSRLDFLLSGEGSQCYLEVKSVTLVQAGRGLFPDAPTLRGRRHLESLVQARQQGHQAAIVFVIQRPDAHGFSSHDEADPAFGRDLRQAHQAGVGIYAYRCRVSRREIFITDEIPVYL